MNKTLIAAIILIVGALSVIIFTSSDVSSYGTFTESERLGERMKVVGQLSKDKNMIYDPVKDPNKFIFFMKDNDGRQEKVILRQAKPQDFELSEQLVLTGKMEEDAFVATDMLMKCPSKYNDEEIYIRSESKG
ncbi:MAG: cytochrome c maturation protein CcmE [Bacteroidetes bacterium]|jgi:cytochrome c-type biogenesis protein CcmE|nr:cytochrome c maturation protein CcmE [Bacteroidota bacterium]